MDPAPPSLLKCPHCNALYTRANWASGNTFGSTLWSDGVMTDGMTGTDHEPLVKCSNCNSFFVAGKAFIKNEWGFQMPKDKIIHRERFISIDDTLSILNNETLLLELGSQPTFIESPVVSNLDENEKKMHWFKTGCYLVRHMLWRKLNDEIRESGCENLPGDQYNLLLANARAMLPLIPLDELEDDQTPLIFKAELHRNLGQFSKSIQTLSKISQRSLLRTKRKMIFLNLVRNRKLVRLWADRRGLKAKLRLWWSWIN